MDATRRRITKIAREVGKFVSRTLKADGIGTGEFDVIHAIRKNPGITQKEICSSLGLDKGAVARQIIRLEAKGYVVRRPHPGDGRSSLLYATEKAESLKTSKTHVETLFYSWLLEDLSESEKDTFSALLERIYRKCREESRSGFETMKKIVEENKENDEE